MDINCSIPCPQIIRIFSSCPSKQISLIPLTSSDIHEIIMIFLSISPYILNFIILFSTTYYHTTRSLLILLMVFIQNFLVEIIKSNLKDPRPNFKCNQQYGSPSNHTCLFTSVIIWFAMEYFYTPAKFKLKNTTFLYPLIILYPFTIYSRVYLHYHSWEQIWTGFILGCFVGMFWYVLSVKVILKRKNGIKMIFRNMNVVNTLTKDALEVGEGFKEEREFERKLKELMEKEEKLEKLKNDLRKLTDNVKNMEFLKGRNEEISNMMKQREKVKQREEKGKRHLDEKEEEEEEEFEEEESMEEEDKGGGEDIKENVIKKDDK